MLKLDDAPIRLTTFEEFASHNWVKALKARYNQDATRAAYALMRAMRDLVDLKAELAGRDQQAILTSVEGRVKTETSFFRKLYKLACDRAPVSGITQDVLTALYSDIHDLCGIRFSCPYYDCVLPTIEKAVRPALSALGYATDLQADDRFKDRNNLDTGDGITGYRAYHFFVKVPTAVSIYGESELCLCEVQARTELQHVWAVKSHDLLYKPDTGWDSIDRHVAEDMKQISHQLRVADQLLVSVRDRAHGRTAQ